MPHERSGNLVLYGALGANAGIAVAKFVASAITGSSSMLTEGVHSLVDSANQMLLLYGQKRARRPPDAAHRSEEHTSELQSRPQLVCRLLLEKKKLMHVRSFPRPLRTLRRAFT